MPPESSSPVVPSPLAAIQPFLEAARQGETVAAETFVDFARGFERLVLWGAGYLGSALGKRLQELELAFHYWDLRAETLKAVNGVPVELPFSTDFPPETTLALSCISGNTTRYTALKELQRRYPNTLLGVDLFYALLCPNRRTAKPDPRYCNTFPQCNKS
ncbi:MAG: hypothetical protein LBR88_08430 [Zoogloeaceae bacterium]|jgi:hypothetical protein|nr:hypothetical protein [Zoogloeaceae bacterium]